MFGSSMRSLNHALRSIRRLDVSTRTTRLDHGYTLKLYTLRNLVFNLQNSRRRYRSHGSSSGYYSSGMRNGHPQMAEQRASAAVSYAIRAAIVGVVGGFAYHLHCNDERRCIPKGQGKVHGGVAPAGPTIGGPFTLVNTENKVFTEDDFQGKWVLLYFGYTSSPETGPTELQKMANTINTLEASKQSIEILAVFVTLDPMRDSVSHLKAYLKEFDPRIVGLTGTNAAVRQMAQAYRVFFRKVEEDGNDYLVECSHNLYLIKPNMEIARSFTLKTSAKEISEEILKEVNKSRSQ